MSAYNGRFMPRSIFGLPMVAVIYSSLSFCCLVMLLIPAAELHFLRPLFLAGCVLPLLRARRIIRAGSLVVIIQAISKERALKLAKRVGEVS